MTTEACTDYYKNGKEISQEIQDQIFDALKKLEELQGKTFGDVNDPLLVSVRFRRPRFHARHDGYDPESWPE